MNMASVVGTGQTMPAAALKKTVVAVVCALSATAAHAGATISFGEDKSISVGLGLRTSYTSAEDGSPSGTSRSSDFELDSVRLYVNASLNKYIKGTFNTEKNADESIKVLDAYAQFEIMDEFNVWAGRMLPPSDRANLDGPYYLNAWSYPGVVSQYPAKFAGRDNGVTVWGKLADKLVTYSVGAYEGHNNVAGASSEDDNLLYAGRLQFDFWDKGLDPAYYTSSTYYGSKDVLSVAVAAMYQKDGVGTAAVAGDYMAWNIDALLEKKLDGGAAVTLEGAYYDYDTDDTADVAPGFGGADATDNVGGITQGDGYLVGAAYLFPAQVGWGKFQPYLRYQKYDNDLTDVDSKQYDYGVNYVMDGHNARISATYTRNETDGSEDLDKFVVGLQLQF